MKEIIARDSLALMTKPDSDLPLRTRILLWALTVGAVIAVFLGTAYGINFVAHEIYISWTK